MKNICPICGVRGRDIRTHISNGSHRLKVFYCRSCCYFWIDPEELTARRVGNYMDLLESVKTVRAINNKRILTALDRLFSEKNNVEGLEIGSGNGCFLKSAVEYDRFHFIGIEPMKESYRSCIEQGLACIYGMFPEDFPPELTGFDIIIFNDVFEHIPRSSQLIQRCGELLHKDGLLVINCPVNSGVFFRVAKAMDRMGMSEAFTRLWQLNTNSPHIHYFSEKSLVRLLEINGFKLVEKPLKMVDLDKKSIADRVHAVPMDTVQAELFIKGLNIVYPLLRFFPDDTKCFIFQRVSVNSD